MNKKWWIISLFLILFLVPTGGVSAQSNLGFQIMPEAKMCQGCDKCSCAGAEDYSQCMRRCVSACEGGDSGLICYNNMCYPSTPGPLNGGSPIDNEIYQCSNCVLNGDCYLNDFIQVFVNIANIVMVLSGAVALVAFIISGFKFLTSMGDESKVKSGLSGVKNTAIGIAIVLLAWTVVSQVQDILGFKGEYRLLTEVNESTNEESDGDGEVGCCVPRPGGPPYKCLEPSIEGNCPMNHYLVDGSCAENGCEMMLCEYNGACGYGPLRACDSLPSCYDRDIKSCRVKSPGGGPTDSSEPYQCVYCSKSMIRGDWSGPYLTCDDSIVGWSIYPEDYTY